MVAAAFFFKVHYAGDRQSPGLPTGYRVAKVNMSELHDIWRIIEFAFQKVVFALFDLNIVCNKHMTSKKNITWVPFLSPNSTEFIS